MSNDAENLKEAAKIMEAFQNQTKLMQGAVNPINLPIPVGTNEFDNQGGNFITPGNGNTIGMGFDNQGEENKTNLFQPVNPVAPAPVQQPIINTNNVPTAPSNPSAAPMPAQNADVCPQCNTLHPPVKHGDKCPNVGIGDAGTKSGIDDTIINKHLVDMRNIIITQLDSKSIKDGKKFFQYAIIELTKVLEIYHE